MLSVADAFAITQSHTLTLPVETIPLLNAANRVLRESVRADRDFPPFDRVAMDGIAIRFVDFMTGQRMFPIVGMQRAGQPQQTLTEPNTCLEVMTGAMLPTGADAVIRYEDVTVAHGQTMIMIGDVQAGQHIHHQATDRRAGDELLIVGTLMSPSAMAVAASVGQTTVAATVLPRVALVSTGDELVDVGDTPLAYQIRRSNTWMLRAALLSFGVEATLHHIVDDESVLADRLAALLANHDLLILSGGVSAGKADFVPDVLARLGVQRHFHKVEQRPGKPMWFGTVPGKTAVFALPGNPVSTVLCYHRYVAPFLRTSLGLSPVPVRYARLATPFTFGPNATYFLPVRLTAEPDGSVLGYPLPGSGSADFANLLGANAFMELPANQSAFSAGEAFPVWSW